MLRKPKNVLCYVCSWFVNYYERYGEPIGFNPISKRKESSLLLIDIVNVFNFETPVIPEELATVVKSHIQLIVKTEKGFAK